MGDAIEQAEGYYSLFDGFPDVEPDTHRLKRLFDGGTQIWTRLSGPSVRTR